MHIKNIFLTCFAAVALAACQNYTTPDGQIPDELMPQALALVGNYSGDSHLQSSDNIPHPGSYRKGLQASFAIQGRTPQINVAQDLAGPGCGSQIGKLLGIAGRVATFEFDPGQCGNHVKGRTVDISVFGESKFLITLFKDRMHVGSARPGGPMWVDYEISALFQKN